MYRYGANIGFYALSYMFTMVVTSEVFLPVFYRLAITSTYEVSVVWLFSCSIYNILEYVGSSVIYWKILPDI